MTKNQVSYQDLYHVIGEFRRENNDRFDKLEVSLEKKTNAYEARINSLEDFRSNLLGAKGVIVAIILIGVPYLINGVIEFLRR